MKCLFIFSIYAKFLLLLTFFVLVHGVRYYTGPSMGPRIHSFFISFIQYLSAHLMSRPWDTLEVLFPI